MIKKSGSLALLLFVAATAFAQTEPAAEKTAKQFSRPNIPGTFVLELGVNRTLDAPSNFKTGFWGSRSLNIYYTYDLRLFKSKISLVPGIGFSLERFKFTNGRTLGYSSNGDSLKMLAPDETIPKLTVMRKSQLITDYLEVPVELKFSSNPDDPARSFKISVGGRIGVLVHDFTKVKYKADGEVKKMKNYQDFNLNPIRYGVYGKVGVGNVSLFMYYNISPMFKAGKGPNQNKIVSDFNTMTIGISLASF